MNSRLCPVKKFQKMGQDLINFQPLPNNRSILSLSINFLNKNPLREERYEIWKKSSTL